MIKIDKKDLNM